MRAVPDAMLDALAGSTPEALLRCDALYDGQVVSEGLDVSSWSLSWRSDGGQVVQGSGSFTVADPDGELAPWGFDEPLSAGGSRIQAVFECAGESVPLGEWVVSRNQPNETWQLSAGGLKWVHGGATVPVDVADLTQLLADDKFMAPEAPPQSGSSVFSEIRRLCEGIIGVEFTGVTDRSVPRSMVYAEERINTVVDLARMVGDFRVTGDGLLEVYNPARPAAPAWEIAPGPTGALVTVSREQSRDNLFNAIVASGQTEDGVELRAYATLAAGPLRFDGPLGRKPKDVSSVSTTFKAVQDDANAALVEHIESASTMLEVHCAPSPLYEIGDWGVISQPVIDGSTFPLVGRCVGVSLSGGAGGVSTMQLSMECATTDVMAVARHIRRR